MRVEKPIAVKMHVVVATLKTNAVKGEHRCQSRNGFWMCFYYLLCYVLVLNPLAMPPFSKCDTKDQPAVKISAATVTKSKRNFIVYITSHLNPASAVM